ncbi:Uncharacterised protein [Mycobacteroides abscessus subsp. abscessus]|nr:Uncharacterised protein [Mycobacteroides abscessus subsp. abscessus]
MSLIVVMSEMKLHTTRTPAMSSTFSRMAARFIG